MTAIKSDKKLDAARPEFSNPPIIEVYLSAQFQRLSGFRSAHHGLLWREFSKSLPNIEDKNPAEIVVESFGPPTPAGQSIRIDTDVTVPRLWLSSKDQHELLQIQPDRIIYNWRKLDTAKPYPRYGTVRKNFLSHYRKFMKFVKEHDLGPLDVNQCEITYINHIELGKGWERLGQLQNVLTIWSGRYSDNFLGEPEDQRFAARYRLMDDQGEPYGRLHISGEPRLSVEDRRLLMRLTLTARGRPLGSGQQGILRFMDAGRESIVRGFTSITRPRMHKIWGRKR